MDIKCTRCRNEYPIEKMHKEGNEIFCDVCICFDTIDEAFY